MRIILLTFLIICSVLPSVAQAQSRKRIVTDEELQKIQEIIKRAETYFREGEIYLRNKNVSLARNKFDMAVETILSSRINIQEFEGLRNYCSSLVEKIYRLEVPIPQTSLESAQKNSLRIGFIEQKFVPSPSDELASFVELAVFLNEQQKNALIGKIPTQLANGKVQIVMDWFQNNLDDPYSMKILQWSKVERGIYLGELYWVARVHMRAKNTYGAYVLSNYAFLIRNNKIVRVIK